ncbi:hypothetical protein OG218_08860 [Kineococcus sp. NBC_00420]|uniref:hypothetical protein n=1 Tax=Kineococcus sp. NBC_00420 TaxID=2903564 RepID=UPI002E1C07FE
MRSGPRRRVLLAAPLAVVFLLGAGKALSLNAALHHRPELLAVLDVVEPWKSSLARGDRHFADGDLGAAEEQFGTALDRAPDDGARCLVRVNLALTQFLHGQGTVGTDRHQGFRSLAQAVQTAESGGGETCAGTDAQTLEDISAAAQQAQVDALVVAPSGGTPVPSDQPQQAVPPDQDALDAIARTAQQSAAERAAQAARDQFNAEDQESSSTPW